MHTCTCISKYDVDDVDNVDDVDDVDDGSYNIHHIMGSETFRPE